jgi:hypothetical protein
MTVSNLQLAEFGWRGGVVAWRRGDGAVLVRMDGGGSEWIKETSWTRLPAGGHQVALHEKSGTAAWRSEKGPLLYLSASGELSYLLAGEGRISVAAYRSAAAEVGPSSCPFCAGQRRVEVIGPGEALEDQPMCEGHRRLGPMGRVYRDSHYSRHLRAFEAAAFRQDWKQVGARLEELAHDAFLGEARSLLEANLGLKDLAKDAASRATVIHGLLSLALRAGMDGTAQRLRGELANLTAELGAVIRLSPGS